MEKQQRTCPYGRYIYLDLRQTSIPRKGKEYNKIQNPTKCTFCLIEIEIVVERKKYNFDRKK